MDEESKPTSFGEMIINTLLRRKENVQSPAVESPKASEAAPFPEEHKPQARRSRHSRISNSWFGID